MTLNEQPRVLWVICDDLVNRVQYGHHRIPLEILRWMLLPTRQITDEVPQGIVPCNQRQTKMKMLARLCE